MESLFRHCTHLTSMLHDTSEGRVIEKNRPERVANRHSLLRQNLPRMHTRTPHKKHRKHEQNCPENDIRSLGGSFSNYADSGDRGA